MALTQTQKKHALKVTQMKAEFFKALSNPIRIRIIDELRDGELTVSEIRERLDVELPNVSQQLAILRSSNLVLARKQGVNMYYSCADGKTFKLLDVAREIMNSHLSNMQRAMRSSAL